MAECRPPVSPETTETTNPRVGVIAALAAFLFWGFVPIFFKLLDGVPALEIIAHRIIWAIPLLLAFLLIRDGRQLLRRLRLKPRTIAGLALSGALVATNWLIFVWAVNADRVIDTSLGYFINPLVNVLLGFLILKERLNAVQTVAVGIAAAGTGFLWWFLGTAPWVSLSLAFSFGFYGLVRKQLAAGPMVGLLWETTLLLIPAGAYLLWLAHEGTLVYGQQGLRMDVLLYLLGAVTILPLIWFNVAARNLALSVVGFFQYLAPTITFLLAVYVYGEPFTHGHKVAFSLIWLSLALVSAESVLRARRKPRV